MQKEYDTFIEKKGALEENREIEIVIRDTQRYEHRMVRCIVSIDRDRFKDTLWIRYSGSGSKDPTPWAIKIIEDYGSLLGRPIP